MVKNHLLSFLRNLSRNKGYAFINISGLAVGFASALLISIYVFQEYNFDRHHKEYEKIYRVSAPSFAFTSTAHMEYLEQNVSGIESWVSLMPTPSGTLTIDQDGFVEDGTYYVTGDYFEVFPQELLLGNSRVALSDPGSLVITESLSKKIFGRENPVGLRVSLSSQGPPDEYTITGVMKDPPLNSYLRYKILARTSPETRKHLHNFKSTVSYCFFRSQRRLNLQQFEAQTDQVFAKRRYDLGDRTGNFQEYLETTREHQPLIMNIADLHLGSNILFEASPSGKRLYLQIFIGIAIFIILLAGINYVNLATAQASRRAKEIGVRKVLGSVRSSLVSGFLSESLLLALFGWTAGVFMAAVLLELMTVLEFTAFNVNILEFKPIILTILLVSILTGLGAGMYPAFYLSRFSPATVLKGNYSSTKEKSLSRNVLVVFQFSISLTLAIFSIFIYRQLNYGLGKDLGFDKEQILVVDNSKDQLEDREQTFREELLQLSSVSNASFSRYSMIDRLSTASIQSLEDPELQMRLYYKFVDASFVPTMGFEMIQGRNFNGDLQDEFASIIVNESMAKKMGGDVLGKEFNAFFLGEKVRIVGVVKDFHYQDFSNEIGPAGFFYREEGNQINVRISNARAINDVEEKWAEFTNQPFDFYFFDQRFNELFKSEQTLSRIIAIFTSLSVFIAFLGFAGLISYQLDRRMKEIGIRKVLGASVIQILRMFSIEFSRLAIVSFFVGAPIAWFVTSEWLKSFAYRIEVGLLPFLLTGVGGLSLIMIVIVFRARSKASANPVETLRSE